MKFPDRALVLADMHLSCFRGFSWLHSSFLLSMNSNPSSRWTMDSVPAQLLDGLDKASVSTRVQVLCAQEYSAPSGKHQAAQLQDYVVTIY